ncbi:MAG TPA: glutamate racemase [Bacillota bacterium]|nr:glutamate racemase [Bacillota bacterium]
MGKKIGVIDSGVGGLTVVNEIIRQLPREEIVYLGDTLRCPYGSRTTKQIKEFTWDMVDFLLNEDLKILVIACNTITAFMLEDLKSNLDIPVVGVIHPGSRAAIKSTRNNHIGVIGTEGTIKSKSYEDTLKLINPKIKVESLACPHFVPLIERGILTGDSLKKTVNQSLIPMKKKNNIDTLILGCTHYPLIKDTIQNVMGNKVRIVSSGEEVARETSVILEFNELLNKEKIHPMHRFYTTGDLESFSKITKNLFKSTIGNLKSVSIERVTG